MRAQVTRTFESLGGSGNANPERHGTNLLFTHPKASSLLAASGLAPHAQQRALRGVADEMAVYEIP